MLPLCAIVFSRKRAVSKRLARSPRRPGEKRPLRFTSDASPPQTLSRRRAPGGGAGGRRPWAALAGHAPRPRWLLARRRPLGGGSLVAAPAVTAAAAAGAAFAQRAPTHPPPPAAGRGACRLPVGADPRAAAVDRHAAADAGRRAAGGRADRAAPRARAGAWRSGRPAAAGHPRPGAVGPAAGRAGGIYGRAHRRREPRGRTVVSSPRSVVAPPARRYRPAHCNIGARYVFRVAPEQCPTFDAAIF